MELIKKAHFCYPKAKTSPLKNVSRLLFLWLHYQPKFYGYNLSHKKCSTPLRRRQKYKEKLIYANKRFFFLCFIKNLGSKLF